jgi:hypothetical protein
MGITRTSLLLAQPVRMLSMRQVSRRRPLKELGEDACKL